MPATRREAHELLLIEEADAWFEYLEATRGQNAAALPRGRALGLGEAVAAPARRAHAPREAPPRGRLTRAEGRDRACC